MSTITTPIYHPRTTPQLILISPGHTTPGWITYVAGLLDQNGANAAFNNPRNDRTLCYLLTAPTLIHECEDFKRVLSSQAWTAEDERLSRADGFGYSNQFRETAVEALLEELERFRVDMRGFDDRSTWSLRAVEVNGPFEIRVDANGHESVVEVPDRRHVYM